MTPELDTEVRALLEERRGDWKRIAADADVSHSWISQFVRGLIPNPGYATLKKLRQHLVTSPGSLSAAATPAAAAAST
jgi:transcriptional regulator with XRE-family HTH domain